MHPPVSGWSGSPPGGRQLAPKILHERESEGGSSGCVRVGGRGKKKGGNLHLATDPVIINPPLPPLSSLLFPTRVRTCARIGRCIIHTNSPRFFLSIGGWFLGLPRAPFYELFFPVRPFALLTSKGRML